MVWPVRGSAARGGAARRVVRPGRVEALVLGQELLLARGVREEHPDHDSAEDDGDDARGEGPPLPVDERSLAAETIWFWYWGYCLPMSTAPSNDLVSSLCTLLDTWFALGEEDLPWTTAAA